MYPGPACPTQMRLESTVVPILLLWPPVMAYGWVCERHVNVAAICVMLFFAGFFSMYVSSRTRTVLGADCPY